MLRAATGGCAPAPHRTPPPPPHRESGVGFARYLAWAPRVRAGFAGKRVVELGAGTGVVSVYLAREAGVGHVWASDVPSVLANLQRCIDANGAGGAVTATPHDWTWEPDRLWDAVGARPVDVVVGTDVLFSSTLIPHLLHTIAHLCHRSASAVPPVDTAVWIASEIRCTATHAVFTTAAERVFTVKEVPRTAKRMGEEVAASGVHVYELRLRPDAAPPFATLGYGPEEAGATAAAAPAAAGAGGGGGGAVDGEG
jgi:predicted nicotinamide N-methyase